MASPTTADNDTPLGALTAASRDLLPGGEGVLVACSGGVDSMSLVRALRELDRWPVAVATVDHGLHPESAEHARFVVETLAGDGLEAEILKADPERVRAGQGPEDAARRERYRLLERCAARRGVRHVLTAHTADDQAETALMRLLLGAGTRGLAGIPPRRGVFARPWLQVPRAAVEAFARERGLDWREDPTNAEDRYLRNRLRQRLGPALVDVFGGGWIGAAARTAGNVRGDLDAQRFLLDRWRDEVVQLHGDEVHLRMGHLDGAPEGLRHLLIRDAIEEAARRAGAPAIRDLERHVKLLDALAQGRGGSRGVDLPSGLRAECVYGRLRIAPGAGPVEIPEGLVVRGPGRYAFGGRTLVVEPVVGLPPPEHRGDGCVSKAAAPFPWRVRPPRQGERFRPYGAPGSKRVARLWSDAHVPRAERASLPVIESADRLVWVAGLRIGHAARLHAGERGWRLTLERPTTDSAPGVADP